VITIIGYRSSLFTFMFYLHTSNKTENLLRQLAEVIRLDSQTDIFSQELFVIQSKGVERMVSQNLADAFGGFANYRYFFPLDFLCYIAEQLGMTIRPDGFLRQTLLWRLYELLEDLDDPVYQPLYMYFQEGQGSLKRFQLACRLANLFDQYQLMRGEMLEAWQQQRLVTDLPGEVWQRALWLRLLKKSPGAEHRAALFTRVIETLKKTHQLSTSLPKRISIIGLHTMPPIFLDYLNNLAKHMDVHLLLLSPCRNYWGDIESRRSDRKRGWAGQDLERSNTGEDHPLLAGLGQQGRDFQNMMLAGADFSLEFSSYEETSEGTAYGKKTVLEKIQADILEGRLSRSKNPAVAENDSSVRIVSCHSKIRELAVLKDHLLQLLYSDETLELRDIIVMAPDIKDYVPLIASEFSGIQHAIADRSVRGKDPVVAAFADFLELLTSRFSISEVLELLQYPHLSSQFGLNEADLETLQYWLIEAGVRWGLGPAQRKQLGVGSFNESSWRSGLDRLLMGYAIDCEEFVDSVLPFSGIEGRAASPLEVFAGSLNCLRMDISIRRGHILRKAGRNFFTGLLISFLVEKVILSWQNSAPS
jgi:exodeoxyribonuclease V gamma subunit